MISSHRKKERNQSCPNLLREQILSLGARTSSVYYRLPTIQTQTQKMINLECLKNFHQKHDVALHKYVVLFELVTEILDIQATIVWHD